MLDRLDSLMALEQSRGKAKEAARLCGTKTWAFSTDKIHSYKTRMTSQEHAMTFVTWARDAYGLKQLALIDARAGELTAAFLLGSRPATCSILAALSLFLRTHRFPPHPLPFPPPIHHPLPPATCLIPAATS